MKRHRNETKRRKRTIRIWTMEEAKAATPYISSVLRSVREHWLQAVVLRQLVNRMDALSGRPNRKTLIARQEAERDADRAETELEAAREELADLDVYCLDPARGEALIPFLHNDDLAWYVFNLFDSDNFRTWRLHNDGLDVRRPIADALAKRTVEPRAA